MQLRDHPRVVFPKGPSTVDQDPQQGQLLVVDHPTQPGHPSPDECDRVRVCGVGLSALTGGEHAGAGRQFRRDVDCLLTVGQERVGHVSADPEQPSMAHTRSGQFLTEATIAL
jgi:hypothetical protein